MIVRPPNAANHLASSASTSARRRPESADEYRPDGIAQSVRTQIGFGHGELHVLHPDVQRLLIDLEELVNVQDKLLILLHSAEERRTSKDLREKAHLVEDGELLEGER